MIIAALVNDPKFSFGNALANIYYELCAQQLLRFIKETDRILFSFISSFICCMLIIVSSYGKPNFGFHHALAENL